MQKLPEKAKKIFTDLCQQYPQGFTCKEFYNLDLSSFSRTRNIGYSARAAWLSFAKKENLLTEKGGKFFLTATPHPQLALMPPPPELERIQTLKREEKLSSQALESLAEFLYTHECFTLKDFALWAKRPKTTAHTWLASAIAKGFLKKEGTIYQRLYSRPVSPQKLPLQPKLPPQPAPQPYIVPVDEILNIAISLQQTGITRRNLIAVLQWLIAILEQN